MLSDLRKSISSILYERVTSPLFGTFIITWIIWNWKIVYLTFFISEKSITGTKIDCIVDDYSQISNLLYYPLTSTFILITIVPFVSNKAYSLSMYFRDKRIKKKNSYEEKQPLTIKQSVELRLEIRKLEVELQGVIEKKDSQISLLEDELKKLTRSTNSVNSKDNLITVKNNDYVELKNNNEIYQSFGHISEHINKHFEFPKNIDEKTKNYYLINKIAMEDYNDPEHHNSVLLTKKGNELYRIYFNENFKNTSK